MLQAKEIYENALALNPKSNPDKPYKESYVVDMINQVLEQSQRYNQRIRTLKRKDEQPGVPYIKGIHNEIDFEIEFYAPLSYGLAALIAEDLGDTRLGLLYQKQFMTLLTMF